MATPRREFTPSEDELVRAVCAKEVTLKHARRILHTTGPTIYRRALELGIPLPEYFRNRSNMGRPPTTLKPDTEALYWEKSITVGKDKYLSALKAVHVFPRSEQYPGSEKPHRPSLRPVW